MQELPDKPTALAAMLSISTSYASMLLNDDRPWTKSLAIEVYRKTGVKLGPIAGATDQEIEVLAQFESKAA